MSVALSLLAAFALFYVFSVKRIGYYFFDLTDIPLYFSYAEAMARGLRPHMDFAVEYPPVALALFAAPGSTHLIGEYAGRFSLLMLAICVVVAALTAATAARVWPAGRRP